MQQHEQTVGLLEAIFGGSNASMSENSEQEQQRYSKTVPRIEMILSVMYGGDKRALEQDMSIARTTVWRFATSGISPNMANKLERKLGLPIGCIHNEAISHEHFLSIVQSVHQRRHPDTAYLVKEPAATYAPAPAGLDAGYLVLRLLSSDPSVQMATQMLVLPDTEQAQLPEACQLAIRVLKQAAADRMLALDPAKTPGPGEPGEPHATPP